MAMTQDELGNWYDDGNDDGNFNNFPGSTGTQSVVGSSLPSVDEDFAPTYSTTGGGIGGRTVVGDSGNGITDALKSVFGGANGLKTAAVAAGALAGGSGLLDNKQKKSGYQGSIPQLQAVRNMVTAPPPKSTGYRPGQGGVNYNSDVYYAPKGALPDNFTGTMSPAAQVAAANAAKAAATTKSNSGLNTLAKVTAGAGIASLLTKVLGDKTNLTGLIDKAGNLTTTGLKTVLDKITGGTKTGTGNTGVAGAVNTATRSLGGNKAGNAGGAKTTQAADDGTTEGVQETIDQMNGSGDQVGNENGVAYDDDGNLMPGYELNENGDAVFVGDGNSSIYNADGTSSDTFGINIDGSNGTVTDGGSLTGTKDLGDVLGNTDGLENLNLDGLEGINFGDYDMSGYDFGDGNTYTGGFDFGEDTLDFARGGMAKGRYLQGNTDGMADKLPARIGRDQPAALSHGEFVVPADVVSHLGNGNSDAGAKKLYQMMDKIRVARTGNKEQGKKINPDKFMPGGLAQAYANGSKVKGFAGPDGSAVGATGLAAAANAGITGSETAPNTFAGDYMANLLGKTQALTESPYQQYMGPLTAGSSDLQNKVFTGLQNTNFPSNLGQSFSSAGAYQPPTMATNAYTPGPIGAGAGQLGDGGNTPSAAQSQGIASQYMNPYLQSVLQPQMEELRRQSQINQQPGLAKLTQAGGYGGSRQAIMESEANRNLLQEQNKTLGAGYANAFDKAQQQFNTEQTQGRSLADLIGQQGSAQRGIEAEGIAADKSAFEEARQNPYNMLTFQQSMLNGMPISASSYDLAQPSTLTKAAQGAVTVDKLLQTLGLTQKNP